VASRVPKLQKESPLAAVLCS